MNLIRRSAPGAQWKRLLLEGADHSGDPVTGGKYVSLSETAGNTGVTTLTVKNGMNAVNERQPNNQPYWMWDISSEVDWDDNVNFEIAIEYTTATVTADDVMDWAGIASDNNQANWGTKAMLYGFRHSLVFNTNPFGAAWGGGAYVHSNSTSAGRHMYTLLTSPKGNIKQSMTGGVRSSDWDQYIPDVRGGSILSPASTSDPVYIVFTAGSMRNLALGSGANVVINFRLWYRVISYEPN